jgi:hypothetical protein
MNKIKIKKKTIVMRPPKNNRPGPDRFTDEFHPDL